MIGNLTATVFVGVGVWLSSHAQPDATGDAEQIAALALTYSAGLLTAIFSQWSVCLGKGPDSETSGGVTHG